MILLKAARLLFILIVLLIGVLFVTVSLLIDFIARRPVVIVFLAKFWYQIFLKIMNINVLIVGEYKHQGALICSNHISWLDIPVVGSALPTYFLSKAELRSIPIIGWLARYSGTLFIQRGSGQIENVKRLMEHYLSKDHCLTFFPEATTGNGYSIRQFHPRLFSAAIDSHTPLLPIAIQYKTTSQPDLAIGFGDESLLANLWRVLGRFRTDVTIHILPIIQTSNMERKVLAGCAMNNIADALDLPAERRGLSFKEPLPEDPII